MRLTEAIAHIEGFYAAIPDGGKAEPSAAE